MQVHLFDFENHHAGSSFLFFRIIMQVHLETKTQMHNTEGKKIFPKTKVVTLTLPFTIFCNKPGIVQHGRTHMLLCTPSPDRQSLFIFRTHQKDWTKAICKAMPPRKGIRENK
jgi:hypothetical protein